MRWMGVVAAVGAAVAFGAATITTASAARSIAGHADPYAAWADFNGDGYDDLAIGAPFDDVVTNGTRNAAAGVVHALYGSRGGLTATGTTGPDAVPHSQVWSQDSPDVGDTAEAGDHFGWALARGDFNGDEYGDLAVGVPDEDFAGYPDVGAVNILYGSANGLVAIPNEGFFSNDDASAGNNHTRIGAALAALDYFDTGQAELAVGAPGWLGTGAVRLVDGSLIDPDATIGGISTLVLGSTAGCLTGTSLATGDFDNDPKDDLVVGAPGCDSPFGPGGTIAVDAGAVMVQLNGPAGTYMTLWQDAGFLGIPETGDRSGSAVAVADVNADGRDDVLAGAPGEDLGAKANAGIVSVALKDPNAPGFELPSNDFTRRRLDRVNVANARFGASLAGKPLGSAWRLIAIGAPGDKVGASNAAGRIWTVRGNAVYRSWHQDSPGVRDVAEAGDAFGAALAMGDLDGNGGVDLAVGVPGEDLPNVRNAGAVAVLYASGKSKPLSATNDDFWTQNSTGIGEVAQKGDRFGSSVR